jgi:hypothetical protein
VAARDDDASAVGLLAACLFVYSHMLSTIYYVYSVHRMMILYAEMYVRSLMYDVCMMRVIDTMYDIYDV